MKFLTIFFLCLAITALANICEIGDCCPLPPEEKPIEGKWN